MRKARWVNAILMQFVVFAAGLGASSLCAGKEDIANYPSKPITMIVPWGPGGSGDLTTRKISERASAILGQPIVIVTKPGGAGVTGTVLMSQSEPDGYTLGFATWSPFTIVPHIRAVPYKTKEDFTWIMQFGATAMTFAVLSSSPWKTFKDFVEAARKNPGKLKYSTPGPLSGQTILMETVFLQEKVKVTFVPVSGGNEGDIRLLGGHIDAMVSPTLASYMKEGKVRGLMLAQSRNRLEAFPDIPTHYELGYNFDSPGWYGIFGPKGLDPQIIKKLEHAFLQACRESAFKDFMTQISHLAVCKDAETFKAQVYSDFDAEGVALKRLIDLGMIKKQ